MSTDALTAARVYDAGSLATRSPSVPGCGERGSGDSVRVGEAHARLDPRAAVSVRGALSGCSGSSVLRVRDRGVRGQRGRGLQENTLWPLQAEARTMEKLPAENGQPSHRGLQQGGAWSAGTRGDGGLLQLLERPGLGRHSGAPRRAGSYSQVGNQMSQPEAEQFLLRKAGHRAGSLRQAWGSQG